jgi:N-methylhydantoinase A
VRIGIDTGGTFTDVVAEDGRVLKLPSRPGAPHEPVVEAMQRLGGGLLVHSTTVATNALLTRSGGPTALVTTAGFEDVLEIGRQARPKLYALHPRKPPPLLSLRFGVDERLDANGEVLKAPVGLDELREKIRAANVRSIAICLLHSYVNPAHEQLVAAALAPLGLPMSLSSQVLPVPREYERTSTTAADAYVHPVVVPYMRQIAAGKILQSNGGVLSLEEAAARPIATALSGPAAGVVGALSVARQAKISDLVTLDMGGTSTDVALVVGGECALSDEAQVAGVVLQLPMLAIHTVGAGGGSIARVDEGGALKVGPESAGAEPGPACYGRALLPTVTDANLILGRLSADHFLGGAVKLDLARAAQALGSLGKIDEVAEGITAVADMVMARAIKAISVERGVDTRDFTLVPFGGAGGMHACGVARELGMTKILIPPSPGLLCAHGALSADEIRERVVTLLTTDLTAAEPARDKLAQELEGALSFVAHLRYRGQSFDLPVEMGGDLAEKFHQAHQKRYGFALPDRAVELVTVRARSIVRTLALAPPLERDDGGPPQVGQLRSRWDGRDYQTPIYARSRLRDRLVGPALIVEYSATSYVPPGAECEAVDGCLKLSGIS